MNMYRLALRVYHSSVTAGNLYAQTEDFKKSTCYLAFNETYQFIPVHRLTKV
jgi:hypothetical protein